MLFVIRRFLLLDVGPAYELFENSFLCENLTDCRISCWILDGSCWKTILSTLFGKTSKSEFEIEEVLHLKLVVP